MTLTQARLNQGCISMSMPCNIHPKPCLTFPFEFSSMTHPIGFDFSAGVSPHMQPTSIQGINSRTSMNLDTRSSLTEEDILTQTPCLI